MRPGGLHEFWLLSTINFSSNEAICAFAGFSLFRTSAWPITYAFLHYHVSLSDEGYLLTARSLAKFGDEASLWLPNCFKRRSATPSGAHRNRGLKPTATVGDRSATSPCEDQSFVGSQTS